MHHITYEYDSYFKILPVINEWADDPNRIKDGKKVPHDFIQWNKH